MFLGHNQLPQNYTLFLKYGRIYIYFFPVLEKLCFSGKTVSMSTDFLFWPQHFISK